MGKNLLALDLKAPYWLFDSILKQYDWLAGWLLLLFLLVQ